MDNEGYPEESELELIRKWDYRDVFNLIEYIRERWNFGDWGFRKEWKAERPFEEKALHLYLSTGGWSGNESIINALLENQLVAIIWYAEWRRGGHYVFKIKPSQIGYKIVTEFAKEKGVSKQYIHHRKDKYEWLNEAPKLMVRDFIPSP